MGADFVNGRVKQPEHRDAQTLFQNRLFTIRQVDFLLQRGKGLPAYFVNLGVERAQRLRLHPAGVLGVPFLHVAFNERPDILQSLVRQLAEQLKKFGGMTQTPVILTSQVMRVHFYRLIEQFYPNVRVLSFNEIANNVQIQSIGSLVLETKKGHK